MAVLFSGTYKIKGELDGAYLKDNDGRALSWRVEDSRNQQWYLQHSGKGYLLKNCASGRYLSIHGTNKFFRDAAAHCGIFPTTWEFTQGRRPGSMCILSPALSYIDETLLQFIKLCTYRLNGRSSVREWRFERLSDDTGDKEPGGRLCEKQETVAKDERIVKRDEAPNMVNPTLLEKDKQVAEKNSRLAEKDHQLREATERLASLYQELAQIRRELSEKSGQLVETENALRRAEERLASRDAGLLRIREQLDEAGTQDQVTWERGMSDAQTRFSWMTIRDIARPNNAV
ncbi:hypothetical protein FRC08_001448 [Ceratobasidium sp. 394]|nr:hypothetical protein FRC08_001448 [Ceratobasidium sp. 394]